MDTIDFKKYHDAVFYGFEVRWEEGQIMTSFRLSSGDRKIICNDFKSVSLTRVEDWGPSVSVYEISYSKDDKTFSITIQSGDNLNIVCGSIHEAPRSDNP